MRVIYCFKFIILNNESKLNRSLKKHQEEKYCVFLLTLGFYKTQKYTCKKISLYSFHQCHTKTSIAKHITVTCSFTTCFFFLLYLECPSMNWNLCKNKMAAKQCFTKCHKLWQPHKMSLDLYLGHTHIETLWNSIYY